MSTTLATARASLRARLDEPTARRWKDADLDRWLYEGAKDIARIAEVLQETSTIECTASTQSYDAPANMLRLYRVVWNADGDSSQYPLEYRDFKSADAVWWTQQAITEGIPAIFTIWGIPGGQQIVLYPTPATDGQLTVQFYKLPATPATDDDVIDLPEGWDDVMVSYAEYMALRNDRDPRWQEAKAIYDERLGVLVDMTRRPTDQMGSTWGESPYPRVNEWLYGW